MEVSVWIAKRKGVFAPFHTLYISLCFSRFWNHIGTKDDKYAENDTSQSDVHKSNFLGTISCSILFHHHDLQESVVKQLLQKIFHLMLSQSEIQCVLSSTALTKRRLLFLEKLKWWDFSEEQLDAAIPYLTSVHLEEAKEELMRIKQEMKWYEDSVLSERIR